MNRRSRTLGTLLLPALLTGACAPGRASAGPAAGEYRHLVPYADYHQHLMSERAMPAAPRPAPLIELPADLAAALEARNRVVTSGDPGELFAPDAMVLEPLSGAWLSGESGISEIAGLYTSDTRFFANGYSLGDSVAVITGVIRSGDYEADELNFVLGLERHDGGAWRIASEAASLLPPRQFAQPITADDLIAILDAVGIRRAVVLSVAYWFGEEDAPDSAAQYAKVRAENDWTAAQAARYPGRLVAFCGIPPLREYAEAEVRRCAGELGVKGIKMHFRSSDVNLHDPDHLARVRRVFQAANRLGLAIVVHAETDPKLAPYDRDEAEIVLGQLVAAAPDVVVQIAHLWGGNELSPEALEVYANAVSSGDPRAGNLYFDLTEIVRGAGGDKDKLALIARQARRIGMDRLLYGSDAHASPDLPPSTLGWSGIVRSLPLSQAELEDIADNVAPYLR